MLSPALVNRPSGTATILPPKPRNPPVLKRMALTEPSGAALTLCTVPILLPSEEKTARPTRGLVLPGAVVDLSVRRGAVAGLSAGLVGLVIGLVGAVGPASGLVAAGGEAPGDGGVGAWVCAEAASSGMPAR